MLSDLDSPSSLPHPPHPTGPGPFRGADGGRSSHGQRRHVWTHLPHRDHLGQGRLLEGATRVRGQADLPGIWILEPSRLVPPGMSRIKQGSADSGSDEIRVIFQYLSLEFVCSYGWRLRVGTKEFRSIFSLHSHDCVSFPVMPKRFISLLLRFIRCPVK